MRIFRLPVLFRMLYPGAIFRLKGRGKRIYLTFDDGPVNGVTQEVLAILEEQGVKATFFMKGEAAAAEPSLVSLVRNRGYEIANHGYHHIKGWKTGLKSYNANTIKGSEITRSSIFRPPFGSLGIRQFNLLKRNHQIVFWDLILYDFDPGFSQAKMIEVVKRKIRPGSVIVMHDNSRSSAPLVLNQIIKTIKEAGYQFGELLADISSSR